ncbi:DUF2971 domain-containing protein [Pseudoflavonifractor sp. 60]|uniref:DUF2971 domain-containing protein n=1 Tax=Pseudoflavonifractor sp. 60 TaxID=2304576 RepID=UPI001369A2EF
MVQFSLPQLDGECVYHYTSNNALLGILQKGKIVLWLTHADYLNDTTEGSAIFERVKAACKNLFEQKKLNKELYQRILDIVPEDARDYPTLYRGKDDGVYHSEHKKCDVYTMSFSADSDSLPMWNYYAGNGYCLHFNKNYLEDFFPTQFECCCLIRPINYSPNVTKNLEREFCELVTNENVKDPIQRIKDSLAIERYFYKDSAFAYENEYRLLLAVPRESKQPFEIKFREKAGYIIPYIEVELTDRQQTFSMIKGVTIGPLANRELATKSIKLLLENRDYEFAAQNIQNSTIPVRY